MVLGPSRVPAVVLVVEDTMLRSMAVRTTTCRLSCAGSPRTSASITSIIYAVESPAIGCRTRSGIIRSSPLREESPSSRA